MFASLTLEVVWFATPFRLSPVALRDPECAETASAQNVTICQLTRRSSLF